MKSKAVVFRIPIDGLSATDVLIESNRAEQKPFWIVTANPEILLEARRDEQYTAVLKQADLRTVDGFGLWLLLRVFGQKTSRVTGVELADRLLELADHEHWRVGLIGGSQKFPNSLEKAAAKLKERYLNCTFLAEQGGNIQPDGTDDQAGEEARHRLILFAPDLLFVAFGHPKQEQWIARHLSDFPNLKIVLGVGGAFDFWSGAVKRAPRFMQQLGLEWLWRLIKEPYRFKRIWHAVAVFPVLFLWERLTGF